MNTIELGNFESVSQLIGNNGAVKNQFIITTDRGEVFQSYDSVIAVRLHRVYDTKIVLDVNKWDYSVTTGKYRNIFLGEKKADTERKIKTGEYTLADLN
jgi:hypothetical protein